MYRGPLLMTKYTTKLRPRGAQTCALPPFCDRDLEINPVTLKLEDDLDILRCTLTLKMKVLGQAIQNI